MSIGVPCLICNVDVILEVLEKFPILISTLTYIHYCKFPHRQKNMCIMTPVTLFMVKTFGMTAGGGLCA